MQSAFLKTWANAIKYALAVVIMFACILATGYGIYANRDRGYMLTMFVVFYGNGNPTSAEAIITEYSTMQACEAAMAKNSAALKIGQLVMSTCTAK